VSSQSDPSRPSSGIASVFSPPRTRTKDRIVKRAISEYNARGPNIDRATYKATITIDLITNGSP
jgi:hypothetical protein